MGLPLPAELCAELGISRYTELGQHAYDIRKLQLNTTAGPIEAWAVVFDIGNTRVGIPFDRDTLRAFGEACIREATGLVLAQTTKGIATNDT